VGVPPPYVLPTADCGKDCPRNALLPSFPNRAPTLPLVVAVLARHCRKNAPADLWEARIEPVPPVSQRVVRPRRNRPKMLRIHAPCVLAGVIDMPTCWDGTEKTLVGEPVGPNGPSICLQAPVTLME
jgi:hypothetical protein